MRTLFLLTVAAFATALLAFNFLPNNSKISSIYTSLVIKRTAIGCSPDWSEMEKMIAETEIPPIPGAGSYTWKISTSNDSAQFYFNQGINMYYSFHIIESMASFKKAARFDPNCAMLYWAQALAYGPNINDLGYAASPEALEATRKAVELSANCKDEEKALIQAMTVRYTADSADMNRKKLNELYTEQMKAAYERFPGNADIATLYADAMMLEHPWDLWKTDGTPKPWTPLIREVLEKILAYAPGNPGANHYYIHVMEPSPFASLALPSADRLGKLTPGLSHTVHMPSHIYLRTGMFDKGVSVNESAVRSYKQTNRLFEPVSANAFLYEIHNLHMQTNNAMLAGRSAYSALSAKATVNSIPADYLQITGALGNYIQYIYMTPTLVDVRFGKWNDLLSAPQPASSLVFANIIWHFGKGMAFVKRRALADAKKELEKLQELMKDSSLLLPLTPFSASIESAIVAENILIGSIALLEKKYSDAIAAFEEAVVTEENMVYNEPRDWMLNPKQYAGNAYLQAGRLNEAKEMFLKDLSNNAENGWALYGLWQVSMKQKKAAEGAKLLSRFRKAFAKADVKLYAPVF